MDGTSAYNDGNRAFLQAILARGTVTYEQARPILAAIFSADNGSNREVRPDQVTEEDFQSYVETASEAASLFDYEIRSGVHQLTQQRIYALVNTTSDPQTQLATAYSADEISFINRVLDNMFDKLNTPRMEVVAITGLQAIKLARPKRRASEINGEEQTQTSTDKGLKHSEVDEVLAGLVEAGWFEKSKHGFYSLTPRAILELRPWLVETYNDPDAQPNEWQRIKFCEACKEIVTMGQRCADPSCMLRLHDICEDAYWRAQRSKKCTKCSREWTSDHYVGERAVTSTEAYQRARGRGSGRRSTLADDIIRQQQDEDSGDDDPEEDEQEG